MADGAILTGCSAAADEVADPVDPTPWGDWRAWRAGGLPLTESGRPQTIVGR